MDPLTSNIRQPSVAGRFYPGSPAQLEETVKNLIGPGPPRNAVGVMAPHAGYVYSGAVAGEVFGAVAVPDICVILGPNHTGLGPTASLMTSGIWRLPGGDVEIDSRLAGSILGRSRVLIDDSMAHSQEHSIEVQIPFLRCLNPDLRIVPISLMVADAGSCRDIGSAVASAIKAEERGVLVVASSDMTHYENQESAVEKDRLALQRITALDPDGLLDTVFSRNISMCGVAPVASMLNAARLLGASQARLIRYATSGDVTGDFSQVVGYAGVIID